MISPHSIARRGLEVVQTYKENTPTDDNDDGSKARTMFFIGYFGIILTFILFSLVLVAVAYTYGDVIATLCMVESPSTNTYVPIQNVETDEDAPPEYSEDGLPKPADENEINLIRTKPITASLRTAVTHLKTRGGFWSRFRGFWCYFVWGICHSILISILSLGTRNAFFLAVAGIITEVALTNLHMTWIHIVISEPSPKRWYQRLPKPALRAFKRMAPAVAIWALCMEIATFLPPVVAGTWGAISRMNDDRYQPDQKDVYITAGQLFLMMTLRVALSVGLLIPATVAMTRVAASMLPEEDETIVPFDRTFGGLTTPEIVGGQGKIGMVEAWKSFNWECRKRLLRTVVKVAAIVMVLYIFMTMVILVEAQVFFGKDFGDIMKLLHKFSKGPGANKED